MDDFKYDGGVCGSEDGRENLWNKNGDDVFVRKCCVWVVVFSLDDGFWFVLN